MPDNFGQFLTFLGTDAAIGAVISLICFNWAWFQARSAGQKIALLVSVSLLMGVGSHLLTTYVPAGVVADLQPYYKAVVSAIVVLGGTQAWHTLVNERKAPPSTLQIRGADLGLLKAGVSEAKFQYAGYPPGITPPLNAESIKPGEEKAVG